MTSHAGTETEAAPQRSPRESQEPSPSADPYSTCSDDQNFYFKSRRSVKKQAVKKQNSEIK